MTTVDPAEYRPKHNVHVRLSDDGRGIVRQAAKTAGAPTGAWLEAVLRLRGRQLMADQDVTLLAREIKTHRLDRRHLSNP